MSGKSARLFMLITALTLPPLISASEIPKCASDAAEEFKVPAMVLQSMAIAYGWDDANNEAKIRARQRGQFGPMGLFEPVISVIARELGVSQASLTDDACTNYRGAAWWLMNRAGGNESSDIWLAVDRYYSGHGSHEGSAPLKVRKIYDKIRPVEGV